LRSSSLLVERSLMVIMVVLLSVKLSKVEGLGHERFGTHVW